MYKNCISIILLCLATNGVAMMTNHKNNSVRPPKTNRINLHLAAKKGDIKIIQNLLPGYLYIDRENRYGETPLAVAIRYNKKDAAAIFLKKGANPNALNEKGATPLEYAMANKSLECTMLLLEKGADPTIGKYRPENYLFNFHGDTPPDEKVTENYKFIVPVHSKILCMRLEPLYERQQKKLALFANFILQRYLEKKFKHNFTLHYYLMKRIRHFVIRKLLEALDLPTT